MLAILPEILHPRHHRRLDPRRIRRFRRHDDRLHHHEYHYDHDRLPAFLDPRLRRLQRQNLDHHRLLQYQHPCLIYYCP